MNLADLTEEELEIIAGGGTLPEERDDTVVSSVATNDYSSMSTEELDDLVSGVPRREPEAASLLDMQRGQSGARFLKGLADLPIGAAQLIANTGDAIYGGGVELAKMAGVVDEDFERSRPVEELNDYLQEYKASESRGQKALGRGEFNAQGLAGLAIPSTALLKGATKLLPIVAGSMGIGASTPVDEPSGTDDFWSRKTAQTAGAGVLGLGGVALGKVAGMVSDKVKPYLSDAADTAGRAIRDATGGKSDDIIAALKADINPLTKGSASEVAVPAGSTKFAALSDAIDEIAPDQADARQLGQTAERMRVIDDIADIGDDAVAFRGQITDPMREDALASAAANTRTAIGNEQQRQSLSQSVAQLEGAPSFKPLPGQGVSGAEAGTNLRNVPNAVRNTAGLEGAKAQALHQSRTGRTPHGARIPAQYSPAREVLDVIDEDIADAKVIESLVKSELSMRKTQLASITAEGTTAPSANAIVTGVDKSLKTPSVVGNPTLRRLMERVKKDLTEMVDEDGVINPEALYAYRKAGLNDSIQQFTNANPNMKQAVTSTLSEVKPLLDEVIDRAAGGGWHEYIKAYAKLSRPVDQAKVGQVLKQAYGQSINKNRTSPAQLTQALEDAKGTLKKSDVRGETLEDVMNPKQMERLNALRADLTRSDEAARLAGRGSASKNEVIGQPEDLQLANPLMREVMVANSVLRVLSNSKREAVEEQLKALFQRDPELGYAALIRAIEQAKPKDVPWLKQQLNEYAPAAAKAATAMVPANLAR